MSARHDPHDVLGVSEDATIDEIHRAFRRRLREHHPDLRRQAAAPDEESVEESDEGLQHVLSAYAALRQRHRVDVVSTGTASGPDALRRTGTARPPERPQPPLRATPVQWLPSGPSPRRGALRGPDTDPTVESLIRWLLDY